jgi:nucleotide-binding universal stress UspA family protein
VRSYQAPAYHSMAQARAEMHVGRAGLPERLESELRGAISRDAQEMSERAGELAELYRIPFDTLAEVGEPAYLVVDAASRGGAEASTLVAVGSRGLGALRRMWLGSVSTNLLRATRGPVLLHPVPKEVQ